jgi:cation diffusion facilitator CzcD-associated flavoprotein CzcO
VVVDTGLATFAYVPDELLPPAPGGPGPQAVLSHTSQHTDLSAYAGQRVAVVGGGQSALESVPRCCTKPAPTSRCWRAMPG